MREDQRRQALYGENAPPSWARLPGARCRAVEHLTKLEGRAKLYRSSGGPKARDQILGVVGDGSVLGLGAALEGRPQSQGAAALTDCVLYALFRDDLIEIMGRFPEAALRLARTLASRNRELEDLVGDLVFHSAPQRVARMLLNLATEEGRVTKRGVVFEPSLSRQEMAEATGISREALSRAREDIRPPDGKTVPTPSPAELRSRP